MEEEKKKSKKWLLLLLLLLGLGAGGSALFLLGDFGGKKAELEAVKETMDLDDLEDYLAAHPEEGQKEEVRELVHDIKFQDALEDNEIATYQAFLNEFPQSEEAPVIQENLDWLLTEEDHSNEAFEEFIAAYPESFYIPRARLRINQNDFWTRTQPVRNRFAGLLKESDDLSVEFYPQYGEYAAQLIAHDLIYEAASILTVLQYHHSAGTSACINKMMALLDEISFSYDITYRSEVLQAKAKVLMSLSYQDVMDEISDLALSGDVQIDTEQYLLDQAGAGEEVDPAEELEKMLKYIQVTPYTVMYPDFVGQCVDFLSSTAPDQPILLQYLQAIHYPESARTIAVNAGRYAPSNFFNGLGVMATRYREDLLPQLDLLNDEAKAVLIYGFGIADDRRAEEKIRSIMESTEDPRLKIACWYALTRFGRDYSENMNTALAAALAEGGEFEQAGDILTSYQWMRDVELEGLINRDLLVQSLDQSDKTILFFALAIMEDLDVNLDNTSLSRVLELSRHEDEQIQERAAALLSASQDSLKRVMNENFTEMTDNEKAMLITSLQKESFAMVEDQVRAFIDYSLGEEFQGDTTAFNQVLGSIGTLGLMEYEEQLLDYLKNWNNFRAGLSLAMLYQEDMDGGTAKLAGLDTGEALVSRGFLGDSSAIETLKGQVNSNNINLILQGINYSRILNDSSFYSRYYDKIRYTNSMYAPTDYYVSIGAQTAAMKLLLQNKELREEVRAEL